MKLFDFAYGGQDFDDKLKSLAILSNEKWSFGDKNDNSILKFYIFKTFEKLYSENKIYIKENKYAVFNTGLFTKFYAPIYAYMLPNRRKPYDKNVQDWELDAFYSEYDIGNLGIEVLPERADFFTDPSSLVFDTHCKIVVQYEHILEDDENNERIPKEIRKSPFLLDIFKGSIDTMTKKVMANYKVAIPQYYHDKVQLLLPLCLLEKNKPDLALVVSKMGTYYQGHTCLTLEMAYNNARLIAKPESNWLNTKF